MRRVLPDQQRVHLLRYEDLNLITRFHDPRAGSELKKYMGS